MSGVPPESPATATVRARCGPCTAILPAAAPAVSPVGSAVLPRWGHPASSSTCGRPGSSTTSAPTHSPAAARLSRVSRDRPPRDLGRPCPRGAPRPARAGRDPRSRNRARRRSHRVPPGRRGETPPPPHPPAAARRTVLRRDARPPRCGTSAAAACASPWSPSGSSPRSAGRALRPPRAGGGPPRPRTRSRRAGSGRLVRAFDAAALAARFTARPPPV